MNNSLEIVSSWQVGFGDPTLIGWAITAGYFLTALACLRQAVIAPHDLPLDRTPRDPWWMLALLAAFLGLNKQLDLQTLLIQFGRKAAASEHWYQARRTVQLIFVTVLTLLTFFAAWWLLRRHHDFAVRRWPVTTGLGMVACYCLWRAAAIDRLTLGTSLDRLADRDLWMLELVGVTLMLTGVTSRRYLVAGKGQLQGSDL